MNISGQSTGMLLKELGEDAKTEDILKVMETLGGVALQFKNEEESAKDLLDSTKKQQMKKPPRKNESLVDETFYVWETRFGLWSTQTVDGYEFTLGLTGMTRDACRRNDTMASQTSTRR